MLMKILISLETSIYANDTANIHYYEQAFVFPSEVTALTTSATKFGIATKDLIGTFHQKL